MARHRAGLAGATDDRLRHLPSGALRLLAQPHQSSFGQQATFVGLANYAKVLGDPYFWRALLNTVIVVVIVVHVELLLGLGMALLFASGVPSGRFCSPRAGALRGQRGCGRGDVALPVRAGCRPMSRLLAGVGLPPLEWAVDPAHGWSHGRLLSIWLHLPFTFIILYAARLAIPKDLYEAASIDGASAPGELRRVTLPLLMPAMLVAMLFRYIFAFRLFSEVWLMTHGGPARSTEVMAVYLYLEAFRYNAFGSAAATGWLMVVASLLLALFVPAPALQGDVRSLRVSSCASLLKAGVLAIVLWSLVPIAFIAGVVASRPSGTSSPYRRRLPFAPTLEHYRALWSRGAISSRAAATASSSPSARPCSRWRRSLLRRLRLFALRGARHLPASAFFLIFIRLIPPIVITLPLFPVVNWLGLNDTHSS